MGRLLLSANVLVPEEMWIAKNGSLVYYSKKEERDLVYGVFRTYFFVAATWRLDTPAHMCISPIAA